LEVGVFTAFKSGFQALHPGFVGAEKFYLLTPFTRKKGIDYQRFAGSVALLQCLGIVIFCSDNGDEPVIKSTAHGSNRGRKLVVHVDQEDWFVARLSGSVGSQTSSQIDTDSGLANPTLAIDQRYNSHWTLIRFL